MEVVHLIWSWSWEFETRVDECYSALITHSCMASSPFSWAGKQIQKKKKNHHNQITSDPNACRNQNEQMKNELMGIYSLGGESIIFLGCMEVFLSFPSFLASFLS